MTFPATLCEVRSEFAAFAARFDAGCLDATAAERAVRDFAAIEKIAGVLKAKAALRMEATGGFERAGAANASQGLALVSGTGVGAAAHDLAAARACERSDDAARAAAQGELSAAQLAAIGGVLDSHPDCDVAPLVAKAKRSSLPELRDECDRAKASGDRDANARRERIRAARSLRRARHADGSASVTLRDAPDIVARLYAHIAPARARLFHQARREGRRERSEALDADALLETLAAGASAGAGAAGGKRAATSERASSRNDKTSARAARAGQRAETAKVIVRVDLGALIRGYPVDGEVCEIAGVGPIATSAVRDLIASNAFLAAVIANGRQVSGVAHLGRRPTAAQQTLLEWVDPTCAREGCNRTLNLERDHRIPWSVSRTTSVDALDRLCSACHDLKTYGGWALVAGTGKRPLVPPQHPDHPDRADACDADDGDAVALTGLGANAPP